MMKRWWHYLLLGLIAWAFFMVVRIPAIVAYELVPPDSSSPIKLVGLHGTLWDGGALLQYQEQGVANSRWRLSPWALLIGRLDASLSLQHVDSYLDARLQSPVAGGELQFSELQGSAPLSRLQHYLTLSPFPLQGELSARLDEFAIDRDGQLKRAEGRLIWYRAGVQMVETIELGDLQMTLHTKEDGTIAGEIHDSGGPLQFQATLSLRVDGGYRLQGKAKPGEVASPALRNALAMLGRPDSQGSYAINLSGNL